MKLINHIINFTSQKKYNFLLSFILCQSIFVIYYFTAERTFSSEMKIMSSDSSTGQLNLGNFSGFLPSSIQGQSKGVQTYSSIIKSKTFFQSVVMNKTNLNGSDVVVYDLIVDHYDFNNKNQDVEFNNVYHFFKNELISVTHNKITNIATINAYTFDPFFSQILLKVVLEELQNRLKNYNLDGKAANRDFILSRISQVENELIAIEDRYITFLKENSNLESPALLIDKKRIEREIGIKENLLKELSGELEISQLEAKRDNQVVVDIIDSPSLNPSKVHPRFGLLLILSLGISFAIPFIIQSKKILLDNESPNI